ncbi:MAG TPA: HAD family hydrolase [Allosphingosinicella sp.]|uniref:HAD family hydrolase n=1 Tax=Allosphingosinicella sp. TaxID=2823234 RepID=UPI002EDB7FE8
MTRPLLITDCDEVLLHMLRHFAEWVDEAHSLHFALDAPGFREAVREKDTGLPVAEERIWPLLDGFFASEMHRQNVVPGAAEALAEIGKQADIVILTNIGDEYEAGRVEQLEAFDIRHRVLCNRGGKGRPVAELIEEVRPSVAVFVDDLAIHHESVAKHAPDVWRLHMIAEPKVAAHMPRAPHAHARIDDWGNATRWIAARFSDGVGAYVHASQREST